MWWDPLAPDVTSDTGTPGAYRHLFGGQRFAEGEIPSEPAPWLTDGVYTTTE